MFTANSTRLLRHASRTLARLMERENRSGSALTAENMSILRKSMKNFINRINARLSPRVVSDDQYLADLEALSELSKLSADQINSSVLAQEKELFQKYFREKGHYKLDLMEKYFNSYFSINVPDNNADQQTWDEYHSSINSFKSSLEGSHSSFVSHILEEVKKKEDEYISEISKYFDQVIAEQFASQMERVELCNRLKLPVKNYLSGSGKNIHSRNFSSPPVHRIHQPVTIRRKNLPNVKPDVTPAVSRESSKKLKTATMNLPTG